ncbi:hypothetical protein CJ030_MR5G011886 [Morella rubra]|uniref:Uncharacterized protein n=1 Tax=Morella rubra TaxID=262757 RepID=A0A6A1VLP1_9ROSI|nr:hypothetical protein CJ030_MR5G011886 [Morella rubra]
MKLFEDELTYDFYPYILNEAGTSGVAKTHKHLKKKKYKSRDVNKDGTATSGPSQDTSNVNQSIDKGKRCMEATTKITSGGYLYTDVGGLTCGETKPVLFTEGSVDLKSYCLMYNDEEEIQDFNLLHHSHLRKKQHHKKHAATATQLLHRLRCIGILNDNEILKRFTIPEPPLGDIVKSWFLKDLGEKWRNTRRHRSHAGKQNRSLQTTVHTAGSKSFARYAHELANGGDRFRKFTNFWNLEWMAASVGHHLTICTSLVQNDMVAFAALDWDPLLHPTLPTRA